MLSHISCIRFVCLLGLTQQLFTEDLLRVRHYVPPWKTLIGDKTSCLSSSRHSKTSHRCTKKNPQFSLQLMKQEDNKGKNQ